MDHPDGHHCDLGAGYGAWTPAGQPCATPYPATPCPPTRLVYTFHAPPIKPVKKRKTGKMYQRNPMLNANDSDHWRTRSPITKAWREKGLLTGLGAQVHRLDLQHARIDAYIHRPINSRSDAANFYPTVKPIIDGLVEAGLLPDDNDNHLAGPFLHKGAKGPYAVTLIITELPHSPAVVLTTTTP